VDEESIESTAVNSAEESSDENEPLKKVDSKTAPRKFVEEEAREEGRVKTAVYTGYMKASGGVPFWSVAIVAYAVLQALVTGKFNRFCLFSKSGEHLRQKTPPAPDSLIIKGLTNKYQVDHGGFVSGPVTMNDIQP
jgi:hypothetical protein